MKITRKQLRRLILEANEQEITPEQKLSSLMKTGIEGLRQAEELADPLGIDLFPILGTSYEVVNAILGPYVDESELTKFLDKISDNSMYDAGFYPTMLKFLPDYKSFSLGKTEEQIISLINNETEEYYVFIDADMGLGMRYQSMFTSGGDLIGPMKDWIIAMWFLMLQDIKRDKGEDFSISGSLELMFR